MKSLCKLIFLVCFLLVPSLVSAQTYTETHYVTQSGAGSKTGRSLSNAWALSNFNNTANWSTVKAVDGKIGPGDVVFFSGNFTDTPVVTKGGTSAGSITLDGYAAGDCDPLKTVCTGSALLIQGMEVGNGIAGPDYLIIQDFRMTRNNTTNAGFRIFPKTSGTDNERSIDNTIIRRNYVFKTNGTMFSWNRGRYNIIEGNKFVHFGQNKTNATQGVNLVSLSNTLIKSNEFGHDEIAYPSGCLSANIVEVHASHYCLFEYNHIYGAPNGANISTKEGLGGNSNIVYRFNKIHSSLDPKGVVSSGGKGITFNTYDYEKNINMYVYGNYIYNNHINVWTGGVTTNLYIWSNIVSSAVRMGIGHWRHPINGFFVYNNTIAYNNMSGDRDLARGGISLTSANSINHIKNNIFWNNHPKGEANRKQIYSGTKINSLEHNYYYHLKGDPTFYYSGGYRTIDVMKKTYGFENLTPIGRITNPLFVDPAGPDRIYGTAHDNYRLANSSPAIDNGKILTGAFSVNLSGGNPWFQDQTGYSTLKFGFEDALCPIGTDWTTNPPTVKTAKQGDYGSGWELGAYVYRNTNETPLSPPSIIDIQANLK